MFSTARAATQSSSPVVNPFAPKPKANPFASNSSGDSSGSKPNKRKGRPSEGSDNEAKPKGPNSSKDKNAGGKGKRGEDSRNKGNDRRTNRPNGDVKPGRRHQKSSLGNEVIVDEATDASRPTSPSSPSSTDFETSGPLNSAPPTNSDPHARKVYTQLHKDGLSPPNWPSRPGDPGSSTAMSKFRERYERYRSDVRKSLTRAGLIDDPNKRRALKDAIEFKGISEDMCPEFEKIRRITEIDVYQPEKDPKSGHAVTSRMVKKLARSAAGQEAPLPMDIRSVPTLRRTLDYLIDDLLQHDGNLPVLHGFLWDRTRAIRRDFTFFSTLTPEELKTQVYVLENIARFHVTALHLLSRKGNKPEDFVEQQELEQLGKTLLSLRDLYDDCSAQDIVCENEAEFRAYYLIFHGNDPSILETLQRSWNPKFWKDSDEVRTAVSLVEAMQNTKNFHGPLKEGPSLAASATYHAYFRIVEDPTVSYTMACFAERHFAEVRRSILRSIARALARPKEDAKDVTAATLNKFLRFDTVEEAIDFAELHDLEFEPGDDGKPRLLLRRQQLPHIRLSHQFSQTMVEKKRGSRSLPQVIHQTVFQDSDSQTTNQTAAKGSLFVQDRSSGAAKESPFSQPTKPAQNPFSAFKPASGGINSSLSNGVTANQSSQSPNPFAGSSNQTQQAASSPFATAFKPANGTPAANPFAAFSQPATGLGTTSISSTAASAKETSKSPQDKPLNIASLPPPKTNGLFAESGSGSLRPTTQPTASPDATRLDKGKEPVYSPDKGKTPLYNPDEGQTPPVTGSRSKVHFALSEPSLASTATPNKPTQTTSNLPSFKPTTTQPPSFLTADKPAAEPTAPSTSLSPSLLPPNGSSNVGQVKSSVFDFAQKAPTAASTASAQATSLLASATPATQTRTTTPAAPAPRRDLMGDFTQWFVNGDGGLMEDFRVYMVDEILKGVYDNFVEEQEEIRRHEEEDVINAEAEAFRIYNLQVKFFYRWKNNARTKRLRYLRKSGREQVRAYHAARREEKKAAKEAAEEKARASQPDRLREMKALLSKKRARRSQAEDDLLASGVLSGLENEREHAARIVGREPISSGTRPISRGSSRPSSSGSTARRTGGKTQQIREQLLGKKNEGFRRSLPSTARSTTGSEPASRPLSNVSARWKLKAMGIVPMPDGTALPEDMANDILYGGRNYPGLSSRPRASSYSTLDRSLPPTSAARPEVPSTLSRSYGAEDAELPATNKRKRSGDGITGDEEAESPHKRVMSESERALADLRAARKELEEGTSWYRSQRERLQSEASSRGTTPWDDSI